MPTVRGTCSVCGVPLEVEVAAPFEVAALAAALCPECADQQFLDGGGAILMLRRPLDGARFPPGKITITPGAVAALSETGEHAVSLLARHVRGEWGATGHCDEIDLTEDERRRGWEATDDGGKINKWSVLNARGRIMSEYTTGRQRRLWIITDLPLGGTTVLLPEEY